MNEEFTYKGFVCTDGEKYRLIVKDTKNDKLFRTIPVNSREEDFDDLNDFTATIVYVKFFDGTEQIPMENGIDSNFDDLFMSMTRCALIQVVGENSIMDIIRFDYNDMTRMWEFVDEYFESETGKKRFIEYSKKNVWSKQD